VLRIVHTRRKDLHGNITVEDLVAGAIDIFHTTSADRLGVCFSDLRLALHQDLPTGILFFFIWAKWKETWPFNPSQDSA